MVSLFEMVQKHVADILVTQCGHVQKHSDALYGENRPRKRRKLFMGRERKWGEREGERKEKEKGKGEKRPQLSP